MALPYGLTERCLLAAAASWLVSIILGPILGTGFFKLFFTLMVIALPAVAVYSVMTVRTTERYSQSAGSS